MDKKHTNTSKKMTKLLQEIKSTVSKQPTYGIFTEKGQTPNRKIM